MQSFSLLFWSSCSGYFALIFLE